MPRAQITRLVPRRSRTDRHIRVEYVCPTCKQCHTMELTKFDKIVDGKYPCRNRKKLTFKTWVDKQVSSLSAAQRRSIQEMLDENKAFSTIIRKFKLAHPAVLHAIVHPTRKAVEVATAQAAASKTVLKVPMDTVSPTVTVNVQAGGQIIMNNNDNLLVKKPFWDTEEGFNATQAYFNQHRQMPPETFDLEAWWANRNNRTASVN